MDNISSPGVKLTAEEKIPAAITQMFAGFLYSPPLVSWPGWISLSTCSSSFLRQRKLQCDGLHNRCALISRKPEREGKKGRAREKKKLREKVRETESCGSEPTHQLPPPPPKLQQPVQAEAISQTVRFDMIPFINSVKV